MTCYTAEEISALWFDRFCLLLLLFSTASAWQWVRVFSMWRNLFWWPAYVSRLRHVLHVRHCITLISVSKYFTLVFVNDCFFTVQSWCIFSFSLEIRIHIVLFQVCVWWSTYRQCAAVCWVQTSVAPSDTQNKQLKKCRLKLQTPGWKCEDMGNVKNTAHMGKHVLTWG